MSRYISLDKLMLFKQILYTVQVFSIVFWREQSFDLNKKILKYFWILRRVYHTSPSQKSMSFTPVLNNCCWFASFSFCVFSLLLASSPSHWSLSASIRCLTSCSLPAHCRLSISAEKFWMGECSIGESKRLLWPMLMTENTLSSFAATSASNAWCFCNLL